MNELTTIRKILERLTKYITKKKGYICQYCGHKTLQPYGGGVNAHNPNPATTTTSLRNIRERIYKKFVAILLAFYNFCYFFRKTCICFPI